MRLVINGKLFTLHDLSDEIDVEFLAFYAASLSNQAYCWESLKQAALTYFNSHTNDFDAHDRYFNNFTIIWRDFLQSGNLGGAESLWQLALEPALDWENRNTEFIHKGTPYYFWGMTAILKGDIDKGYALMHQSLCEDIRTSGQLSPDTPSLALATLNFSKVEQAFRQWVLEKARLLERLLNSYCSSFAKTLDVENFRNRLLLKISDKAVVFLFSYTIARLVRLNETPGYIRTSNFAGQLQLNLFFDVALVIDAVIKEKNVKEWKFIRHLEFLSSKGRLNLDSKRLREINSKFTSNFNQTITDALDNNLKLSDGYHLNRLEDCLALTYGIRNHGAHDVSSAPVIWQRFSEVQQCLFNTLFLSADTLY